MSMGMFDDVDYECPCPRCGKTLNGFQSKSGDCSGDLIQPDEVDNFYTICHDCDSWIEFTRFKNDTFFVSVQEFGKGAETREPEYEGYVEIPSGDDPIEVAIRLLEWYSSDVPLFSNIHSRNTVNAEAKKLIKRLKS